MRSTAARPAPVAGGWRGADLAAEPRQWQLTVTEPVADELIRLAGADTGVDPSAPQPMVSDAVRALAGTVRGRLAGHPGFVLLRGFPVGPRRASCGPRTCSSAS